MTTTPVVLTFPNYSAARFMALVEVLRQKGLTLSGAAGDVKRAGADVKWDEAASGTLTLTVLHAPFWHNMDTFVQTLTQLVNNTVVGTV